ncbi:MAG: hypothetical protein N4A54_10720 [Peptostreptococcaceae bacterium]|nr:hypothetical protein [Peptostreptococcaceae bacterium]
MDNKTKEEKIEESKETIKNKKHDQGYKNTFKNKDNMIDFLNSFIKEDWVKNIKKEDLVLIDKEFILSNFIDKKKNLLRWIKNVIVENRNLDNKEKLIGLIDETIETQEVDIMISNMGRVINEGLEAKLAEGIKKGIAKGEKI